MERDRIPDRHKVTVKRALDLEEVNDAGEAHRRKMGRYDAPPVTSSDVRPRTLLEAIGIENDQSKFAINTIKRINQHHGLHNHTETIVQLKTIKVPVLGAINLSRTSRDEYTTLWLARMGQPSLGMLKRMQSRNAKAFSHNSLKSDLTEDSRIQAKASFRAKSHSAMDAVMRCKQNEHPWDVILFDGHGPMDVPSVNGYVYAYYFRSFLTALKLN